MLWSPVAHKLPFNFSLARNILQGSIKKLQNSAEKLKQYDDVFRQQEESDIIEKINDVDDYIRNNNKISFLGHMAVYRDKPSSPCRIVYLSNVGENGLCHSPQQLSAARFQPQWKYPNRIN